MATKQPDEPVVQLTTRVPESLAQHIKLWCVEQDVTMMDFVEEALRAKLRRAGTRRP